jgi:hypothetical protein
VSDGPLVPVRNLDSKIMTKAVDPAPDQAWCLPDSSLARCSGKSGRQQQDKSALPITTAKPTAN